MIDPFTTKISFLIFEAVFCALGAIVYAVSEDHLRLRKAVVLSLNVSCCIMLVCEYLFYVYRGCTDPVDVVVMRVVNAGVYYMILLLMFFYAMLVAVRLFERFDLKADMPCRRRFVSVCILAAVGLVLVTVSQFTGIYYSFDANNVYQRGPLYWIAALIPSAGGILVASVVIQHREKTSRVQRMVLLSYIVMPLVGEVFQYFFPGNSWMNICVGISVLLLFFENMIHKEKEVVLAQKTEIRTGLANEHGYIAWLNSMKGKPELRDYAAVFFDLRKFSDVNRRYGVENGNRILAGFANIMRRKIAKDEILGRQFGNQFLAIVKKQNLDNILDILKGVEVPFTDVVTEQEGRVTLSARVGVYQIDRTDIDGETMLVFAGQALNAAKTRGTDDVVWLTQELIDAIAERKKLESSIRMGLDRGEFQPYYQPKVNVRTGRLCGAEALSRWRHKGAVVSPSEYIPIMEANDTICLLDFHLLQVVCEDIAHWLEEGISVPLISVNFSRRNLTDPDLAKHIDEVVTKAGVPKDLIEIEVTESVDEFSVRVLRNFVNSLHELGYKVSIDDFGSKSSSLTLLREISFDTLKIDKGFVDHVNEKDIKILTGIIRLAGEMNMDIVAEGVEQKSQIGILTKLGVDVIQGFYFDRPLPKEVMIERLMSPEYACTAVAPADATAEKNGNETGGFADFVEQFSRVACILAVDLMEDDDDRRYVIVDANEAYKRTVVEKTEDFVTGVPYTRYIPKAVNFEMLCDNCVLSDKPVHTYFDIELYNAWMEVYLMPLASNDPARKKLLFSYEMNPKADVDKMADISSETSANVLKTCLKLRETDDFQKAMEAVVEDIRIRCGAGSCRILVTDFAKRHCELLCEAIDADAGVQPMATYLSDDFFDIVETWPKLINKSTCFIINDRRDMENASLISPAWVASLKVANVERLAIFPLRSDEETIGYIWVTNFDDSKTFMIRETLNLTSFILSAEIANEQNIRKMKIMSSTDLLTGVYNRNAMNNRISDHGNGTRVIDAPFGVFFIDVNGLKTTNDTKGHIAGDELLKDVAATLREYKSEQMEVYRVGGDEFMIIAPATPRDEFEALAKTLRENSERPNRAHFAVGACHGEEVENIYKAMQTADARMYEVKEEYYARHPEYEWHNKLR